MVKSDANPIHSAPAPADKHIAPAPAPAPVIDIDAASVGKRRRFMHPKAGSRKKTVNGKATYGSDIFHLWTEDLTGRRVRTKKEKKLGPGTMPKHEAQRKLADYQMKGEALEKLNQYANETGKSSGAVKAN